MSNRDMEAPASLIAAIAYLDPEQVMQVFTYTQFRKTPQDVLDAAAASPVMLTYKKHRRMVLLSEGPGRRTYSVHSAPIEIMRLVDRAIEALRKDIDMPTPENTETWAPSPAEERSRERLRAKTYRRLLRDPLWAFGLTEPLAIDPPGRDQLALYPVDLYEARTERIRAYEQRQSKVTGNES